MQYMKGGGFGRTLARAWSSQSGRRISGTRLPREERKALVESFVKEYQQSNNGKFPSITLTQQQVGGSFPVVRHILQEVKVGSSRDQVPKLGLAAQSPQGTISTQPQSSSGTLSSNVTVSMADEHPRLDGAHHPFSDGLGTGSKQQGIENPRKVDSNSITVEKLKSGGANVTGFQASGSEVKQLGGIVLAAYHLQGDMYSDRVNAAEVQTSGSQEQNEHAKEVPDVVVNTPPLAMNESAKQSLLGVQASGGSMRVEETVEVKTSEVKATPKRKVAVDTSYSQPVLTGDREELETRNQSSSSDQDHTSEQSYSRSEQVEIVTDDTSVTARGVHQSALRAEVSDNVGHSRERSKDEGALEVPMEWKTKTIGAALKSFVVTAFRKFWP